MAKHTCWRSLFHQKCFKNFKILASDSLSFFVIFNILASKCNNFEDEIVFDHLYNFDKVSDPQFKDQK